jgi:hypothetical protein
MNPDHLKTLFGPDGCINAALAEGDSLVLRVTGDCMHPDLAHQTAVRLEQPQIFVPGDVVAFHCPRQNCLLIHRFLGYVWRRGAWRIMTMADRASRPDPLIDVSQVFGRVIAHNGRTYRVAATRRWKALKRYVRWCGQGLKVHLWRWVNPGR